ncbi:MAG: glycosyltransferase family 2 protein [Muribaculaceae bacterium]|nr:glycosyltransferase family 2 protein [Muribaculaceae bacterium]
MTSSSCDISVIVPAYNSAATLSRALESILGQEIDAHIEILVCDDASTDNTTAIAAEIASRHPDKVRLIGSSVNRGLVTNYFEALAQCRGRYIADCAPDDYWLGTDTLARKYRLLEKNPEAVAVYTPWEEVNEQGQCTLRTGMGHNIPAGSPATRELIISLLQRQRPAPMHLSTMLYRTEVIRQALAVRPDRVRNTDYGIEDLPIMLALASAGTILYLPTPSLGYTVGQPSISNPADAGRCALFSAQCSLTCRELALYYGIPLREIRDSMRHHLAYALSQARHSHNREIKRNVVQAVRRCHTPLSLKGYILKAICV